MGRIRSGYEFVRADQYPDRNDLPKYEDGRYKGVIGVGGLILMRCPIEVKEDREEYFLRQTQGQKESVENDIYRDEHPSMPIQAERQSNVTFGPKNKKS
jgi:hypothetical protein